MLIICKVCKFFAIVTIELGKKIKIKWMLLLALFLIVATVGSLSLMFYLTFGDKFAKASDLRSIYSKLTFDSSDAITDTLKILDTAFIKSIIPEIDSNIKIINLSYDPGYKLEIEFDVDAGKYVKKVYAGRRINIAVTGVDSRLGERYKHADANHVISILIDNGKIEIFSIPRDTYADAGYDDTTGFNKLSNVRGAKGRDYYLSELASIAGLDKIHFWVEFGFSQAMGFIEWFGHENPKSTLRVLRSRQALGGDDFQRVYNQAQFMKQMILNNFDRISGLPGEVIIRGAIALAETNLSASKIHEFIRNLRANGFGNRPDDIEIKIRPPFPLEYKVYDFSDPATVLYLSSQIDATFAKSREDSAETQPSDHSEYIYKLLQKRLDKIVGDTITNPTLVINGLAIYFEQKAWFQVNDSSMRHQIRTRIADNLYQAYLMKRDSAKANAVLTAIKVEDELFNLKN